MLPATLPCQDGINNQLRISHIAVSLSKKRGAGDIEGQGFGIAQKFYLVPIEGKIHQHIFPGAD